MQSPASRSLPHANTTAEVAPSGVDRCRDNGVLLFGPQIGLAYIAPRERCCKSAEASIVHFMYPDPADLAPSGPTVSPNCRILRRQRNRTVRCVGNQCVRDWGEAICAVGTRMGGPCEISLCPRDLHRSRNQLHTTNSRPGVPSKAGRTLSGMHARRTLLGRL